MEMKMEDLENKFKQNVTKNTESGGLNAIAYALMGIANVLNRSHSLALEQIKKLEKLQEKL